MVEIKIYPPENCEFFPCKTCGNPAIRNKDEKFIKEYDGHCIWCIVNDETLWKSKVL